MIWIEKSFCLFVVTWCCNQVLVWICFPDIVKQLSVQATAHNSWVCDTYEKLNILFRDVTIGNETINQPIYMRMSMVCNTTPFHIMEESHTPHKLCFWEMLTEQFMDWVFKSVGGLIILLTVIITIFDHIVVTGHVETHWLWGMNNNFNSLLFGV